MTIPITWAVYGAAVLLVMILYLAYLYYLEKQMTALLRENNTTLANQYTALAARTTFIIDRYESATAANVSKGQEG